MDPPVPGGVIGRGGRGARSPGSMRDPGAPRPPAIPYHEAPLAPAAALQRAEDPMLYLSQAIGRPVLDGNGEPIGKVADLIVAVGDRYPPVTGLVVETDRRRIFLPWSSVASFDLGGARLATSSIDIAKFQQRPNEILLKEDLMDKQIVDIDGRKVVRVNDLRIDEIEGKLPLVAVDVGAAGILRRLGIEGPFRTLARNLSL